jgi:hypothetical protein
MEIIDNKNHLTHQTTLKNLFSSILTKQKAALSGINSLLIDFIALEEAIIFEENTIYFYLQNIILNVKGKNIGHGSIEKGSL